MVCTVAACQLAEHGDELLFIPQQVSSDQRSARRRQCASIEVDAEEMCGLQLLGEVEAATAPARLTFDECVPVDIRGASRLAESERSLQLSREYAEGEEEHREGKRRRIFDPEAFGGSCLSLKNRCSMGGGRPRSSRLLERLHIPPRDAQAEHRAAGERTSC